ncbi:MAG: hypothetical protein NZ768_09025 [Pseudomonadales bacterium]|nr:hypothetical protein [Pseudomonadales bacterium]
MVNRCQLNVALFVLALAACSFEESDVDANVSYQKNVESCLCRFMDFETDSHSGLYYAHMQKRCNETVHGANPSRYKTSLYSEPDIEALRCRNEVDAWLIVTRKNAS